MGPMDGVYRKNPDVVERDIAGETILVPIKGKLADMQRIFSLNPVAAYIWRQMDGRKSLGEIRDGLLKEFEVTEEAAETDIEEFVGELLGASLIKGDN